MKIGLETEMRNVCREDYCQGRRKLRARCLKYGFSGVIATICLSLLTWLIDDDHVKMRNTFLESPRVLSVEGELEKLQIATGEENGSDQLKFDDPATSRKQRERARDFKRSDSRKKMRKQGFLHFLNHSIAH